MIALTFMLVPLAPKRMKEDGLPAEHGRHDAAQQELIKMGPILVYAEFLFVLAHLYWPSNLDAAGNSAVDMLASHV